MTRDRVVTAPFVLAVVVTLGVFLAIGTLLPVLPLYAKGPLGAGSVGVGLAVAAASATALLAQPLAGRLGDRRGRRLLVIAGPLLMAASISSYVAVDSLAALLALRLVTGVGEALSFVGVATVVNDLAPEERRGETVSLYSLGVWGGFALGPLVGETVLGDSRYQVVWLVSAGFALAAAVVATFLPETRPAVAADVETRARLVHPAAVGPGLVQVTSAFGAAGFTAFVALYARDLGLGGAGPVFFAYAAIIVSVRVLGRTVPDRLGPRRAAVLALCLLAVGLLTIGLWSSVAGLYAGTVVFALGTAFAFPSLMALAVDAAPEAERSAVVGTFSAFADVGFGLGAISLGAVASVAGYEGVFVVAGLAALGGLAVLARLRLSRRTAAVEPA